MKIFSWEVVEVIKWKKRCNSFIILVRNFFIQVTVGELSRFPFVEESYNNHYSVAFSRLVVHLNILITFIHNKQANFLNILWLKGSTPFCKIFNHQSVLFCNIKSLDWQNSFSLNQVSLPNQVHLIWIYSPSSISFSGSGTKSWSVSPSNTAHVQSLSFSVE